MNRFKFRIWSKLDKKFVKWYVDYPFELNEIFTKTNYYSFQQFTGLLDKNGKEIYEGDIIKIKGYDDWDDNVGFDVIYQVRWCDIHVGWRGFTNKMIENNKSAGCGLPNPITIIGNIFENPELLEKNKKV